MSYLADVKRKLRETFDQALEYAWEDMETALKSSYRNGYEAGVKAAKEGSVEPSTKPGTARRWKGRGTTAGAEEEGSDVSGT